MKKEFLVKLAFQTTLALSEEFLIITAVITPIQEEGD